MIKIINYHNRQFEETFEDTINQSYEEVRLLLPRLPKNIQIYFTDEYIIKGLGVGGFAYSDNIISVSLDPHFKNKDLQKREARSMIFHESLHLYQNYTGQGRKYPPLETAIYEGMATIFERDYTDNLPPYGDYASTNPDKLHSWLEELSKIPVENYTYEEHSKWAFRNHEKGERWIIYRLGTWIVDEVLNYYDLSLLDIKDKTAKNVLRLFKTISKT